MKQITFIDNEDNISPKYTAERGSPIYIPKDRRPSLVELLDSNKSNFLIRDIEASQVTMEEKRFLSAAAQRHLVFNYELIADYYAHATPPMQRLMEASALVIVDIDQAIELGYVKLCKTIHSLHMEELYKSA